MLLVSKKTEFKLSLEKLHQSKGDHLYSVKCLSQVPDIRYQHKSTISVLIFVVELICYKMKKIILVHVTKNCVVLSVQCTCNYFKLCILHFKISKYQYILYLQTQLKFDLDIYSLFNVASIHVFVVIYSISFTN